MTTQYVRSSDPIENLRLRITLRCVKPPPAAATRAPTASAGAEEAAAAAAASPTPLIEREWISTFSWQEKAFGPSEIAILQQPRAQLRAGAARRVEEGYRQMLQRQVSMGAPLPRQDEDAVLFTLVDRDGFAPSTDEMERLATNSSAATPAARAIQAASKRGSPSWADAVVDSAASAAAAQGEEVGHVLRESAAKFMYIMAAVRSDGASLARRGSLSPLRRADVPPYSYHVLCAVQCQPATELMAVQPKLQAPAIPERPAAAVPAAANGSAAPLPPTTPSHARAASAWSIATMPSLPPLAPRTSAALLPYRFTAANGAVFAYAIENEAGLESDPRGAASLERLEAARQREAVEEARRRVECPLRPELAAGELARVHYFVELHCAQEFDAERIFLEYKVSLPASDSVADAGVTHMARVRRRAPVFPLDPTAAGDTAPCAHFCFPVELCCTRQNVPDDSQTHLAPTVFLAVYSVDRWDMQRVEGYGHMELPPTPGCRTACVRTWRPEGSLRDQRADYFVGGSRVLGELADVGTSAHLMVPGAVASGGRDTTMHFFSKLGLRTETRGKLALRVHTVLHDRPPAPLPAPQLGMSALRAPTPSAASRSLSGTYRSGAGPQGASTRRSLPEIMSALQLRRSQFAMRSSAGGRIGATAAAPAGSEGADGGAASETADAVERWRVE